MRRLNAEYMAPTLSIFDGIGTDGCYVRIAEVYRTIIQSFYVHPFVPTHQFVFDRRLQIGCAEIRDARDGSLVCLVENLAIPSAATRVEEINAA